MNIYCCGCEKEVKARSTSGEEIYPHRKDLATVKLFICDACKNYVGTHRKTGIPLGVIPTKQLRIARMKLHEQVDPLWKASRISRTALYKDLSDTMGFEYHTAKLKNRLEVEQAFKAIASLRARMETDRYMGIVKKVFEDY